MFFEKQQVNKPYKDVFREIFYGMSPQDGYHGTPYTFDRFDDSKFYTGEGGAAHGEGHYSSRNKKVALKYKKPLLADAEKIKNIFDLPNLFPESDKATQDFMIRNKMSQLKSYIQDGGYSDFAKNKWLDELKKLEDLYNNRVYTEGNLYRVNIPNKNQMLWEYYYMDEQPKYIQDKLKPYLENKKLIDPEFFARKNFYDMNGKYLGPMGKDIYNDIGRKGLQELGIKGINSYGFTDGDINVTFSGDDIKMANTPWQRFKNRLPLKQLGALADKIISSPWFRAANEYAIPIQAGLEYYPQLDLILEKDPKQFSKKYNKYMNIEEGKPGYMDEQGNIYN